MYHEVGAKIVNLEAVEHPTVPHAYGVRVNFECCGCKRLYHIDTFEEVSEFLESLRINQPTRMVQCVECNPFLN